MQAPKISTAIPQRRYQFGSFIAVILGDVQSSDGVGYRYICALVADGSTDPSFYVALIRDGGRQFIRVITEGFNKDLELPAPLRDVEVFSQQALAIAQQMMGLSDETPIRLM